MYNDVNSKLLTRTYLCLLQEFTFRLYNYFKVNDKIWFLNPALAILNDIENYKKL